MGNPRYFYKRALQCLAHCLVYDKNAKQAKEWEQEDDIQKLEEFILSEKEKITEKDFFYNAGRTTQGVIDESEEMGTDAFNACCGGIVEFEYFIGIREYNEDKKESE